MTREWYLAQTDFLFGNKVTILLLGLITQIGQK